MAGCSCAGLFLARSVDRGGVGTSSTFRLFLWYRRPTFLFETERTWRDVLSGRNSAFITVLLLETLRLGRRNKKIQKKRPCPVAPASGTKWDAAIRDSRDGCKFSRRVQKKTSFLFIFFIFWKRVHTCLYYLSLPVCFTLLDCSR